MLLFELAYEYQNVQNVIYANRQPCSRVRCNRATFYHEDPQKTHGVYTEMPDIGSSVSPQSLDE